MLLNTKPGLPAAKSAGQLHLCNPFGPLKPNARMNSLPLPPSSRREFLQHTGRLAAVSALAGTVIPHVHAAGGDTIQIALIGCGGRGTGAAANALANRSGPIKLVAMADIFEARLNRSIEALKSAATKPAGAADSWVGGF